MSYVSTPGYEAEILPKNCLAPLLKPIMGMNSGRNAPLYRTDDNQTAGMRAHQMNSPMRRWVPGRSIKLMSDTAYSMLELGLHPLACRSPESPLAGWMRCQQQPPREPAAPD
jgi:hypothetical protein